MKYVLLLTFLFTVQANAKTHYKTAKVSCPKNEVMFYLDGKHQCLNLDGAITESLSDAKEDSRIDRYISNSGSFDILK